MLYSFKDVVEDILIWLLGSKICEKLIVTHRLRFIEKFSIGKLQVLNEENSFGVQQCA